MNASRAAELLAMLTARVHSWEPAIGEFDRLRREDVALALSLVAVIPARLIARIKYADQTRYVGKFEDELISAIERGALMDVVSDVVMPQEWRYPRKDFLRDLCRLALAETLSPKLCGRCRGHGFVMARKGRESGEYLRRSCERCNGSGKRLGDGRYEEKERAKLMGVNPDAWCHTWRDRYKAILIKIESYEAIALEGVNKRLARA